MTIHYSNEVKRAQVHNQPIVALESTVITHGLPYPNNLTAAQSMQQAVRDNGAIPATIAIIEGNIHVGLEDDQLEWLAKANLVEPTVRKCSRRDLPIVMANKLHGATTVSATMIIANQANISVFATGGIGGVHRGTTFDVSADINELSRTPVAVVSSGVKSILDIMATLEYLETYGVPVLGYQTDTFPTFYSRDSDYPIDQRVDDVKQAANVFQSMKTLNMQQGMLLSVPIPEQHAIESCVIEPVIETAIAQAEHENVRGKESTPFLLSAIAQITGKQSLQSNVALLINNAKIAAQLACELM